MKIGIITPMDEEIKSLREALLNVEKKAHHNFVFETGAIGKHEVVLVQSGIGKVMSAIAVSLLVEDFEVDAIINTGSAGALDETLAIGDVVIANQLAYHDVDVTAFGYEFGQMAGQPLYYEASKYFVSELKKVLDQPRVGLITSSDSFIASSEKISEIKRHFPNVLAVEMEGASVAQASVAFKKPFVIIRAISDTANHEASVKFDDFVAEAGRQSAATLIQLLERME